MNYLKTLLAIVIAASLSSCGKSEDPAHAQGSAAAGESGQSAPSTATPPGGSLAAPAVSTQATQRSIQERLCPQINPECASVGRLDARSEREAQWLIAHGYPSRQENERLHGLGLEELSRLAKSGNRAAAVVYAEKLALDGGQFDVGFGLLHQQAAAGNLFAYYALSDILYKDPAKRQLVDSAAYLKVAYLLGDARATQILADRNYASPELLAADVRAAGLLDTFSGGVQPSPRPLE